MADIARSIIADKESRIELALPGGYTYAREAVEPDTKPTSPSSRSIGPQSSVIWIMTGSKATDYTQGYPYRWVYAAQATYESSDGQIVRKTYRDSAASYLLPVTGNALFNFINAPLPSGPMGGMISVIIGYQIGQYLDQWHEQDGNLMQYWEIMAWVFTKTQLERRTEEDYWQAVTMNSKIDGDGPKL